jgi:hypothetical protein
MAAPFAAGRDPGQTFGLWTVRKIDASANAEDFEKISGLKVLSH